MSKRLVKLLISLGVSFWDYLFAFLKSVLSQSSRATYVVLYYHSVYDEDRTRFARQMDQLLRWAKPVAIGQLGKLVPGNHYVSVTFDDGFTSVVRNALPELERRRIPCALFVPSGSVGKRPTWVRDLYHPAWKEEVISADQLQLIAQKVLVTIGSHSVSHPNFLRLPSGEAATELSVSKADLERVICRPVRDFSFPHGAQNSALHKQAFEAGYDTLFTSTPCLGFSPTGQVIGRVAVNPDDWPLEFQLKLKGAYRWSARIQTARRKLSDFLKR